MENEEPIRLLESIGLPALFELVGEEATELSHASLKLSRVIRAENPTPVSREAALDHLAEEVADVELVIEQLRRMPELSREIDTWKTKKRERLRKRLAGENV